MTEEQERAYDELVRTTNDKNHPVHDPEKAGHYPALVRRNRLYNILYGDAPAAPAYNVGTPTR